jgi:hypothetical protein
LILIACCERALDVFGQGEGRKRVACFHRDPTTAPAPPRLSQFNSG